MVECFSENWQNSKWKQSRHTLIYSVIRSANGIVSTCFVTTAMSRSFVNTNILFDLVYRDDAKSLTKPMSTGHRRALRHPHFQEIIIDIRCKWVENLNYWWISQGLKSWWMTHSNGHYVLSQIIFMVRFSRNRCKQVLLHKIMCTLSLWTFIKFFSVPTNLNFGVISLC